MAKLILRYPNNVIKEVEFDQPLYRIGRGEDNNLILEGDEISLHQAEIETSDGTYILIDVSEDNSTTVNGKKIERTNITYGDRIAFGKIIGLFYPSKKKTMGEKTKLALYIGAGAGVIFLSIALIFIFTARQISTVVSQQIGEILPAEEFPMQEEKPEIQKEKVRREKQWKKPEKAVSREKEPRISRSIKRRELVLPEPDREIIRKRASVAIPRGVGRLLFRKIPVPVEVEEEIEISRAEELPESVSAEELPEYVSTEELQAEGFFSKIASPFRRLFKGEEEVFEEEEAVTEFPETEKLQAMEELAELPVTVEIPEKPSDDDIRRIIDPLAVISVFDVPHIGEYTFEEIPVYSEGEIEQFEKGTLFEGVELSQSESINIDILWRYPELPQEAGKVVRSGMVGLVDEDKFFDFLFGTVEGEIVALNGITGEEIFREELGKPFFEPILIDMNDDKKSDIIITYEEGDIEILDSNLERIWYYEGKDRITTLPLIMDVNNDKVPDIIFTTLGMEVAALDGKTGFELWRFFDAESEIVYPPVGADINEDSVNDIVFLTLNGFLFALDGNTGWGLWKREIYGSPAGPCSVGDLDGDGSNDIVSVTKSGILSAYRNDGKLLFTWETGDRYGVSLSIADTDGDGRNEIVLIDEAGIITVMEGATRREKWNFESEEGISTGRIVLADITADGGMDVIFSAASGAISVLDGETGSLLALHNSRDYVLTTPILYDVNRDRIDEIIICTYGGNVFAVQVTDSRRGFFNFKKSSWIATHHDVNNTGYSATYFMKNPGN